MNNSVRFSRKNYSKICFLAAAMAVPNVALAESVEKPGTILVSAEGTASVSPDMATISLTVMRQAKTARAALSENNAAMKQVLDAMKEAGVEKKDLQTSNFGIWPQYVYPKASSNGAQKPPRIVSYSVSNSLTVRIRDLANVGTILDRSVSLGVNQGGQITFGTQDPSSAIEQARKDAMKNAIAKAKTLTEAAGVELGKILTIAEQGASQPRPRALAQARMARSVAAESVPVASGENNYSISVSVSWALKQ